MALPLDSSNEEYFEFDSSSEMLEVSASSYLSSNSADDEDDEEDAEPYTLEEGQFYIQVCWDLKSVKIKVRTRMLKSKQV